MARKILAIDIQEDSVAAVWVKSGLRSREIEGYAYVPSPDGLGSALEVLSGQMALSHLECIVSLPAGELSFRNLTVPFGDTKKIRQILPYEMEPSLPQGIEHFRYDFISLSGREAKDQTPVFAALAQKPYVEACLRDLSAFKLHPLQITCGGYAPAHILAQDPEIPEQVLLVDGGRMRATLVWIVERRIRLIRSVWIDPGARSESLCSQIERTRLGFEAVCGYDVRPERILVTGYGFDDSRTVAEMTERLGASVQGIDIASATGTRMKGFLSADWNPPQFNGALALAVLAVDRAKGINFRDSAFDQEKILGEHSKPLIKIGILVGLILAMAGAELFFDAYRLNLRVRHLDRQIAEVFQSTFPDVQRIVDPVHQMRLEIEDAQKRIYLTEDTVNSIRTIDLLNEISRRIPETVDVEFTRLVVGPESLLIDGNTDTFNAVDEIKNRLDRAKLFKGVTISSANIDRAVNRVQFKLRGVF